jgi:hypothetical protein
MAFGNHSRESNMPYGYLILVTTAILAVRHVRSDYASKRSKCLVGGVAAITILAPYLPNFLPLVGLLVLVSMYLQMALCGYVIFHQAIYDDEASKALHQKASPANSTVADQ